MREIKFRGKRINNGEWVFGDLIQWKCGSKDIAPMESDNIQYCVIPDTVGQFTGLKDKNGREIFEGDIVNFDDSPYSVYAHPYTGKVVFYKGQFCVEYYEDCFTTRFYTPLFKDDFADKKTTVLGNIYDNPELLENNSK